MSRVADAQSQGFLQTGTRGAKSACTLFFYNVFSDVLMNAEASILESAWRLDSADWTLPPSAIHAKRTENAL